MLTKEYQLTRAVLNYAIDCSRDGDWSVLRDAGFGEKEITTLQSLNLGEFSLLAQRIKGHALDISLNRDAFWLILASIKRENATEQIKTEMVRRDAPAEMMRQLFRMGGREYTAMRRALGRPIVIGRPPEPDIYAMDAIWRAWQNHGAKEDITRPEEWLALADEAGVDLRTVWRFVQAESAAKSTL